MVSYVWLRSGGNSDNVLKLGADLSKYPGGAALATSDRNGNFGYGTPNATGTNTLPSMTRIDSLATFPEG